MRLWRIGAIKSPSGFIGDMVPAGGWGWQLVSLASFPPIMLRRGGSFGARAILVCFGGADIGYASCETLSAFVVAASVDN